MAVAPATRRLVLTRAEGRCEYCLIDGWPLTVDHIVPPIAWAAGELARLSLPHNPDAPQNLAAACAPCNRAKWNAITGSDELTSSNQPLFNPRQHQWREHFAWTDTYQEVVGLTPTGRATVATLRLNRGVYRHQRRLLRAAMRGGGPPWP